MNNKELQQESSFKTFLTAEVKFVFGIVVVMIGVVGPYYSIKEDIALIQKDVANINSNHEAHIQDILEEMKDLKTQQLELQKQILLIKK